MSWSFHAETGSQASDAMNNINSWINEHKSGFCSKFAASDMKGKDARAVVFYSNEMIDVPSNQPGPDTKWARYTQKTDTNYDLLYSEAANALSGLSEEQQFYSSVMFTNASGHDALIEIIYPVSI
ncbi:hypothetical protein [Vibrio harveyi]|uniref:hypothetical protein n=1 Tax=Vibrio harveyi TaxID=669 RepID=UPI00238008B8|nr:hypothetical protein [Vibrio harveyi]